MMASLLSVFPSFVAGSIMHVCLSEDASCVH